MSTQYFWLEPASPLAPLCSSQCLGLNDYECDMGLTFPLTSRDNGKSKSSAFILFC